MIRSIFCSLIIRFFFPDPGAPKVPYPVDPDLVPDPQHSLYAGVYIFHLKNMNYWLVGEKKYDELFR